MMKKPPIGIQSFESLRGEDYVYVDFSAKAGARQIEARDYALPFATAPRKLFRVAVNFNTEKHNIDEWQINSN